MLRVGLIGAGAVADLHLAAIAGHPDSVTVAVCDLDPVRAAAVAARAGGSDVASYDDHRRMLDEAGLDAVIVNTPHALHAPMTVEALERGIAVLVEKPLANDLPGCDAVLAAGRASTAALAVGQIQHFLPEKVAAARAIAEGRIGSVLAVDDRRTTDYRPGSRPGWFFDRRVSGGGAMINIGGHCIDRTVWLAGSRAAAVRARMLSRWDVPVETDAWFELELASGVTASITVRSDQTERRDELTVVGEHGSLSVVAKHGAWLQVDGRTTQLHASRPTDIAAGFAAQWDDFVTVATGGVGAVPLAHARHVVEVVTAGYAAATRGHRVAIDEVAGAAVGEPDATVRR